MSAACRRLPSVAVTESVGLGGNVEVRALMVAHRVFNFEESLSSDVSATDWRSYGILVEV